jgi:hypothetical protein
MKKLFLLFIFFFIFSCKEENKSNKISKTKIVKNKIENREFSKVLNLSNYPKTEFVATLEQEISKNKNIVYASTLGFAWENLKNNLKISEIDKNAVDLISFNKSCSYLNSLNKNEIKIEFFNNKNHIQSKAFFSKSIPFEEKLLRYEDSLVFNNTDVENFGFDYNIFTRKSKIKDIFNILYFKNNDDFIFKFLSKDKEDEIIIYKNNNLNKNNLKSIIEEVYTKIEIGKKEKNSDDNIAKYNFNFDLDEVRIPVFNFNIETRFSKFENTIIKSKNKEYMLDEVYQRNTFVLDEYGAKVESEAIIAVKEELNKKLPKPKLFILDSDFIIIIKKKNSKNPYFVILNKNEELMTKFKQK